MSTWQVQDIFLPFCGVPCHGGFKANVEIPERKIRGIVKELLAKGQRIQRTESVRNGFLEKVVYRVYCIPGRWRRQAKRNT